MLLIHLGSHGSTLVKEIFASASSFIKKPATLSTLVTEIDKLDCCPTTCSSKATSAPTSAGI